jgi:hypothetical protein
MKLVLKDISVYISPLVGLLGIWLAWWTNRRAERRAAASDARADLMARMAIEAHKMAREAHGAAMTEHELKQYEVSVKQTANAMILAAIDRARGSDSSNVGIALKPRNTLEEEAVLSLKGDPRIRDVTWENDGTVRIWINGSEWPDID